MSALVYWIGLACAFWLGLEYGPQFRQWRADRSARKHRRAVHRRVREYARRGR